MTNRDAFEPVTESGWRMGFSTLVKKELKTWFGSKTWWQQGLLWSLVLALFGSIGIQDTGVGLAVFYMMATIFPSIATIIIAHEVILEEKRSGSAAWVLSKPVSRTAFMLSKFIHVGVGFTISMILIPGLAAYLVFAAFGVAPDFFIFLISLGPLALWQMFLAFLTICMGTFFSTPGPTMAVPFPFLFVGVNLGQDPLLGPWGPWGLFRVSLGLVNNEAYPIYPVLVTLAILAILVVLAVYRFKQHEF
ncbi:MAG: ABC transporter permease [Candidatus Thorarchaeota archaeon]